MSPVEQPMPESEPGWSTPWGLLGAVALTFVLGGLVAAVLEWLK
jgi:hypothetical protein